MERFRYAFLFLFLVFFSFCSSPEPKENNDQAPKSEISFQSKVYDFGTIAYDSDGRCYFEFTNSSVTDLIINKVRTTCGCTRPEWPEEPIPPGGNGRIGVSYNTKLAGNFSKTVHVYSNTENSPTRLLIKGNVEPATQKN